MTKDEDRMVFAHTSIGNLLSNKVSKVIIN